MTNDVTLHPPTAEEITQARLPARYEAARTAIAECVDLEELKALSDRSSRIGVLRAAWVAAVHPGALVVKEGPGKWATFLPNTGGGVPQRYPGLLGVTW